MLKGRVGFVFVAAWATGLDKLQVTCRRVGLDALVVMVAAMPHPSSAALAPRTSIVIASGWIMALPGPHDSVGCRLCGA